MIELLTQMDGFEARGDVKVIMATNKIETLDPALLHPVASIARLSFRCRTSRRRGTSSGSTRRG